MKTSLPHIEELVGTPEFFKNPYPVYARLRTEAPVYWCAKWKSWLITRNDDVMNIMRDPQTFSNVGRHTLLIDQLEDSSRSRLEALRKHFQGRGIVNCDPPDHTHLRKLANKAFTPGMIEALRPRVERIMQMLIDRIESGKPFDIISSISFPLPAIVISEMLGAPRDDWERLKNWSEGITSFSQSGKVMMDRAVHADQCIRELTAYFSDLIQQRRKEPRDDLISTLAAVSEDGETLNDGELFDTCVTLLIAGHETTTSLVGNGMLELLRDPVQLNMLREEPGLMKSAVEEMLRFHSPVLLMHRRVAKDTTLRGHEIAKGDLIYMVLASANRDPEVFTEPDRFNIRRPTSENKHVAFGYGIHFCLGAPLSRMEAPVAIRALLTRFPNLRLDGEPHWKANAMVRFLEHLPVRN